MFDFQEILQHVQTASLVWMLIGPFVLMVFDFITGLANAWAHGDIISSKMRTGGVKKLGECVVLAIGLLFMVAYNMPKAVEAFISFYISVMELISIAENLRDMGVPLPWFFSKGLKDIEKQLNEEPQSGHPPDDDSVLQIEHSATEDDEA